MILTYEDYQAIEKSIGVAQAAPLIFALEKLEHGQKVEIKKDLLLEIATKTDIANLRTEMKVDILNLRNELKGDIANVKAELKGDMAKIKTDISELKILIKILIGLAVVSIGLFSPMTSEIIKLLK